MEERRSTKKFALLLSRGIESPDSRVAFVIVHRFRQPGTDCLAGEEIFAVLLEHPGEVQLRLPLATRLLFDYLGHQRIAQSATQIAAAMRRDAFYVRHAANSRMAKKLTRRMSRSAIRVYVARIREALQLAFDEAGIDLNPADILVSERTVGNEVGYKLRAKIQWIHLP